MGLDVGPFGIGEVGLVCSSHTRYSTELLPQNPFSDCFVTEFWEVHRAIRVLRDGSQGPFTEGFMRRRPGPLCGVRLYAS